jgi:hypothetical protein
MGEARRRGDFWERRASARGREYGYKPMSRIAQTQWNIAVAEQQEREKERRDKWARERGFTLIEEKAAS